MEKPMKSASHVGTRVLEPTNARFYTIPDYQGPLRIEVTTSPKSQIGRKYVPVQNRVKSDQVDLSEDKIGVSQVQYMK